MIDVEFRGIERIHPAPPLHRPGVLPRILDLLREQPVLGDRDDQEPVDKPLEPRRRVHLVDGLQNVGGREARIARACEEEVLEQLEIETMGGASENHLGCVGRRGTVGARVTERAIRLESRVADAPQ